MDACCCRTIAAAVLLTDGYLIMDGPSAIGIQLQACRQRCSSDCRPANAIPRLLTHLTEVCEWRSVEVLSSAALSSSESQDVNRKVDASIKAEMAVDEISGKPSHITQLQT